MATSSPYDNAHSTITTVAEARPRVSWGAIFAAVVIALALQILFGMLGAAIGASTIDPVSANGAPDPAAFGIGAGIWWVVTSLLSMLIAGWVAGHLAGTPRRSDAMLHGLAAWALATVLMLYLVSSAAGSLFSGVASVVGKVADVSAQGVAAAAPAVADQAKQAAQGTGFSWDEIKQEARSLLAQTGKPELQPEAIEKDAKSAAESVVDAQANEKQDIGTMLEGLFAKGKDAASQVDRDAVINVMTQRTGMSREEAAKQVEAWENSYQQSKQKFEEAKQQAEAKARQAADATAEAVSKAALLAFIASLLGALAAMFGARKGASRTVASRTVIA